jgi:hypothetical protein
MFFLVDGRLELIFMEGNNQLEHGMLKVTINSPDELLTWGRFMG